MDTKPVKKILLGEFFCNKLYLEVPQDVFDALEQSEEEYKKEFYDYLEYLKARGVSEYKDKQFLKELDRL